MAQDQTSLERRIRRHHERGELKEAATAAIEGFGPEILGFLVAIVRDEHLAGEVFAQFCEDLWNRLAGFRSEMSFRTWGYALACKAWRLHREPHFRKTMALSDAPEISSAEQRVGTMASPPRQSALEERAAQLRQSLDPEDQALLILHLDRAMSWREIGMVMLGPEESQDREALSRKAAALQARYQRVTEELKRIALKSQLIRED